MESKIETTIERIESSFLGNRAYYFPSLNLYKGAYIPFLVEKKTPKTEKVTEKDVPTLTSNDTPREPVVIGANIEEESTVTDFPRKKEVTYGDSFNYWKLLSGVAILLLLISLVVGPIFTLGGISRNEAKEKTENFVSLLLGEDAQVSAQEVSREYGLYKVALNVNGEILDAYISPDGKYFFAQPINLELVTQLQNISDGSLLEEPEELDEPDLDNLSIEE